MNLIVDGEWLTAADTLALGNLIGGFGRITKGVAGAVDGRRRPARPGRTWCCARERSWRSGPRRREAEMDARGFKVFACTDDDPILAAGPHRVGADAVLLASPVTRALEPALMAEAIALAVRSGRLAYRTGMPRCHNAMASSPTTGMPVL